MNFRGKIVNVLAKKKKKTQRWKLIETQCLVQICNPGYYSQSVLFAILPKLSAK